MDLIVWGNCHFSTTNGTENVYGDTVDKITSICALIDSGWIAHTTISTIFNVMQAIPEIQYLGIQTVDIYLILRWQRRWFGW